MPIVKTVLGVPQPWPRGGGVGTSVLIRGVPSPGLGTLSVGYPRKDMRPETGVSPGKDMGPESGYPPQKGMEPESGIPQKGPGTRIWESGREPDWGTLPPPHTHTPVVNRLQTLPYPILQVWAEINICSWSKTHNINVTSELPWWSSSYDTHPEWEPLGFDPTLRHGFFFICWNPLAGQTGVRSPTEAQNFSCYQTSLLH